MRVGISKIGLWGVITLLLVVAGVTQYAGGEEPQPVPGAGSADIRNNELEKKQRLCQDYTLFIGGVSNPQGALAAQEKKPEWVRYAQAMNQSWERFENRQLRSMRDWAAKELATTQTSTPTVFYPFSGPDFLNMHALFPKAQTYLMIALEPVGELPDFAAGNGAHLLPGVQRALYELLQLNFFITAKLRAATQNRELKGVLPVLLFFLAREKAQVQEINYWLMEQDGAIKEASALKGEKPAGKGIPGVRIVFTSPGSTEKQTLSYFSVNLSNESWKQQECFASFLKGFGPLATFEKAASYLMFRPYFSAIREFILARSLYVLQTDSGIPLRHFDQGAWSLKFYGNYNCPIRLFSNCRQADMAEIYRKRADIQPLPFGFGYHHRVKTSNLMFAARKDKGPAETKPPSKPEAM
jgi:hypothetical protein